MSMYSAVRIPLVLNYAIQIRCIIIIIIMGKLRLNCHVNKRSLCIDA